MPRDTGITMPKSFQAFFDLMGKKIILSFWAVLIADAANGAGFDGAGRGCFALQGAFVLTRKERFINTLVDKIPGE